MRTKEKMPIIHKMDLKELYILSFYFHAFGFIIRTKYGFTKIKGHTSLQRGQLGLLSRRNTVEPRGR